MNSADELNREEVGPYDSIGDDSTSIPEREPLKRLLIRERDRAFFLSTQSIHWIGAEGDFVRLHAAGQSYRIRATMSALHKKLGPDQFLRVNRSSIVNVDHIAELHIRDHGDYDVLLRDGTLLKLSRLYRQGLQRVGGIFGTGQ